MKRPYFAIGLITASTLSILACLNPADSATRRITQQEPNSPTAQIAGDLALGDTLTLEGTVRNHVRRGRRSSGSGGSAGPVSLDDIDRYQIVIPQVNKPGAVQFTVSGNSQTKLRVFPDINNNRQIDSNEAEALEISGQQIARKVLQPGAYIISISRTGDRSDEIPGVAYVAQIRGVRPTPRPPGP